jgi:ankyrin repeat protein
LVVSHPIVQVQQMDQFQAAEMGDLQQLRVALTVNNVNAVDNDGWTALHCAAMSGSVDCVKLCIEMGANVDTCDNHGYTPLYCVADHGYVDCVKLY